MFKLKEEFIINTDSDYLIELYLKNYYPPIPKFLIKRIKNPISRFKVQEEFFISNRELGEIFGCQESRVIEITRQLVALNIITKTYRTYFDGNRSKGNYLCIQINLPKLFNPNIVFEKKMNLIEVQT